MRGIARLAVAACLLALAGSGALAAPPHWVGTWASSQQAVEPENSIPADALHDITLRQFIRLSLGGETLRLRLSNVYGTAPLHISSVHIARPSGKAGGIDPASDKPVTFSGHADVTIPAGADYLSDPVAFAAAPLSGLAVTLHLDEMPVQQTGHPGSRTTSYFTHGDTVSAATLTGAKTADHWYVLSGVDTIAPENAAAVVTLGDSITDGRGSTTNGNDRWPDILAQRLQAEPSTRQLAVLNAGIGGNRLLQDGKAANALARFDRDVLAQSGVRYLIVLEGVNDLGVLTRDAPVSPEQHNAMTESIMAAYEQITARAHARGIKVYGATIMPYGAFTYYHPDAANEADRQTVNAWIRTSSSFDGVIDFDAVMRDPANPARLNPAYDVDGIHPSPAGYKAMAEAISLSLFGGPANARVAASNPVSQSTGGTAAAVASLNRLVCGNIGWLCGDAEDAKPPQIAFTFDDLPAHSALPPGVSRTDVARDLLAAWSSAKLPPVWGFVNGVQTEKEPDSAPVLEAWRGAGHPLGNHTWSHMNLNRNSVEDFEADTLKNEPLLGGLMGAADWRWFRYPYLAEGDTPEKRAALRTFLADHNYKIAGVTMSFSDFAYNEPYARCMARGDSTAVAQLEREYLAAAEESIGFYRGLSQTLYGRDIPYVLLMHIGAFDARMIPRLLDLYKSKGFEFITLEEAEKDPVYRFYTDPRLAAEPDGLEKTMAARGLQLPPHTDRGPMLTALCR